MCDVSVIVPVFNAESFISESLRGLHSFLSTTALSFEIIAVDDGSTDGTGRVIKSLSLTNFSLLELSANQGKFGAISAGMVRAKGRCRVFTDCDLPYDLRAIPYMVTLLNERGFHLVIGDRSLPESDSSIEARPLRSMTSWLFSNVVRLAVTGEVYDSQCGLKGFRSDVAAALFPLLRDRGFSGDVELLYISLKYNLAIRRIPVRLVNAAPSSVRVLRHGMIMLGRIFALRGSWKKGCYESPELRSLSRQKYY